MSLSASATSPSAGAAADRAKPLLPGQASPALTCRTRVNIHVPPTNRSEWRQQQGIRCASGGRLAHGPRRRCLDPAARQRGPHALTR